MHNPKIADKLDFDKFEEYSPEIPLDAPPLIKRIELVKYVDLNDSILEACWWFCTMRLVSFNNMVSYHYVKKRIVEIFGITQEDAIKIMRSQIEFSYLRMHVRHAKLRKHPQFIVWYNAFRKAIIKRCARWYRRGYIPIGKGKRAGWSFEVAATVLNVTTATLRQWYQQHKVGKIDDSPPEHLDKYTRFKNNKERKAALREDKKQHAEFIAKQERIDAANKAKDLEDYAKGVKKTAADISLVPRKRVIASMRPDASIVCENAAIKITTSYHPHEGQIGFHNSGARFRYIVAGRRGGKSRAGAEEAVRHALMIPGSWGWIVGPTYPMLEVAIRAILQDTILRKRPDLIAPNGWLKSQKKLILSNGSLIEFRSAEWEDSLRGSGLDWIWMDECQMMSENAFRILEATTSDTLGRIWGTGTPMGRNWLYREWMKGQDIKETDNASWRFPSTMNPMVPLEEIARARRGTPREWFRQEYLAEFVEGMSSVFGNLEPVLVNSVPDQTLTKGCVMGADLGKEQDFTVLTIMNPFGHVLEIKRFNKESWSLQKARIKDLCVKYDGCPIVGDSANVGGPIIEDLVNDGMYVHEIQMHSARKKNNLIEQLMIDVEGQRIMIPMSLKNAERMKLEMQLYRREFTKFGNTTYHAPAGEHDDCVVSLALANWGIHSLKLGAGVADLSDQDIKTKITLPGERENYFRNTRSGTFHGAEIYRPEMSNITGKRKAFFSR